MGSKRPFLLLVGSVLLVTLWRSQRLSSLHPYSIHEVDNSSQLTEKRGREVNQQADTQESREHPPFHMSFTYKPPPAAGIVRPGKAFKVPTEIADETASLANQVITLTNQNLESFVFAMASSENHFAETLDGLAAAQFHFPGKPIYYYDIGLTPEQVRQVGTWKSVHYRLFDFSKYPEFFSENLRFAGWKPYIVRDMLKEHGAVLWMDASVRLHSSNFTDVYAKAKESTGFVLFKSTGHSNYAATHQHTYQYIPTDERKQMQTYMTCSAAMLIYNTRALFENVLWWWFLCAHERDCQAPMRKTMCAFSEDNKKRDSTFANCHKWDQSTINILLTNYRGYNNKYFQVEEDAGVITLERWPTNYYTLQTV